MADSGTSTTTVTESTGDSTTAEQQDATATETTEQEQATTEQEPATGELGDAGKKAIDAMKAERNTARDELKSLRAEFDAFRAAAEGKQAEHEAKLAEQKIRDEALAAANERIASAELRVAAKGLVNDDALADLHLYINPKSIEVDDHGGVDANAITTAINDLISKKPYLGAQGTTRFQGSADGGARNGSRPASVDEQIAAAEKAGDWKAANALKAQQLMDIRKSSKP